MIGARLSSSTTELANHAVRLLLAPSCALCRDTLARPLAGPICTGCWSSVRRLTPPLCARCGDSLASWRPADPCCPRCRRRPPAFALARSGGRYEGALREIVHAFKYGGRRALAGPLCSLMRMSGHDVLVGADAVVPVPLHPWRAWTRGFNQADDLACALGAPVWRLLRRARHGPPQASLPAARRRANVRGAFAVGGPLACLSIGPSASTRARGSVLVLVDDVMTTGATLDACARALLDAGAREVRVLTAARAVRARSD
jgi:ComF family protein